MGCHVFVQEPVVGWGPRRNITRGSFFGATTSPSRESELDELDDGVMGGDVASDPSLGSPSRTRPIFMTPLTLRVVVFGEGEGAGLPLLLFTFRSRSVIEVGAGAGVFCEGGEAVPREDNISSVRSSQGSLATESDGLLPRRFLVAFST